MNVLLLTGAELFSHFPLISTFCPTYFCRSFSLPLSAMRSVLETVGFEAALGDVLGAALGVELASVNTNCDFGALPIVDELGGAPVALPVVPAVPVVLELDWPLATQPVNMISFLSGACA